MNAAKIINNLLTVTLWTVVAGGILCLLVAANGNSRKNTCAGHEITIRSKAGQIFVTEREILKAISSATGGRIKDASLTSFDLHELEEILKKNVWIRDAELWFDSKEILHVTVMERDPVARVFTTKGKSFLIDATSLRMPLPVSKSPRLPVFTNFPDKARLSDKDSVLLHGIRNLAGFIMNDPFWMAQVAQVDITPKRDFEIVPVVGNHIIRLGDANEIEKKFNRLFVFYKQVITKTGFDKYSTIDVQYDGQVVGTRQGSGKSQVDSAQLKINVRELLNKIDKVQKETEAEIKKTTEKPDIKANSQAAPQPNGNATTNEPGPNAVKTNPVPNNDKPKAVMPKKE